MGYMDSEFWNSFSSVNRAKSFSKLNVGLNRVNVKFCPCIRLLQGIEVEWRMQRPTLISSESEYAFLTHQSRLFLISFITELLKRIPDSENNFHFNYRSTHYSHT